MSPPRAPVAESASTPAQVAAAIEDFLSAHAEACVVEDGRVIFDLRPSGASPAKYTLTTEHQRCTLHLWSEERNLVRRVVETAERGGALRLRTQKFGQSQTKLLELIANRERRTPTTRETTRTRYLTTLERVMMLRFGDWKADGFRTAQDLHRSFGPAYARGSLIRGQKAWAVVAVNDQESATTIDGILTVGVLWLDDCRERAAGRRLYQGLRLIVPRGSSAATLSRLRWMSPKAAQWELYELDAASEELVARDPDDQGNLHTRLIHHPDEAAARERFAPAVERVLQLVPPHEHGRVEQHLRSPAELAFRLHGLEFARARLGFTGNSFAPQMELTVGVAESETELTEANAPQLAAAVAELFRRRHPKAPGKTVDPLFRASPERWLESVLRKDLAPLTRHLGPAPDAPGRAAKDQYANEVDADTLGNRVTPPLMRADEAEASWVIPRLDPKHVYAQVPAIAGARDRGLLDLLGVTADGRLAVIELKADEDLHLALQGLDYWIRVRHHQRESEGAFERHGYFCGVALSPLEPRLYLVAPALRIHPATEVVLRYVSPQVEWHLLALDERWRERVKVVWRKQSR